MMVVESWGGEDCDVIGIFFPMKSFQGLPTDEASDVVIIACGVVHQYYCLRRNLENADE